MGAGQPILGFLRSRRTIPRQSVGPKAASYSCQHASAPGTKLFLLMLTKNLQFKFLNSNGFLGNSYEGIIHMLDWQEALQRSYSINAYSIRQQIIQNIADPGARPRLCHPCRCQRTDWPRRSEGLPGRKVCRSRLLPHGLCLRRVHHPLLQEGRRLQETQLRCARHVH